MQKIYTKELHRFLENERESPIYVKHISKRSAKKGKTPIIAVPRSSKIIQKEGEISELLDELEADELNMDTLKQQHTTKINTYAEEAKSSVSLSQSEKQHSEIEVKKSEHHGTEINAKDIKIGLIESISFTVRVTDTKMQQSKIVTIQSNSFS